MKQFDCVRYEEKYREALCNMINNLYLEDPEGEPMAQDKIDGTILQAQEHPDRLQIFMITDSAHGPVGYAIIQLIWSNEWGGLTANIDEMYICEEARGLGITTDFIEHVPDLFHEVNRLTLEVTPSNDDAMRLYERLGFREIENRGMEKVLLTRF